MAAIYFGDYIFLGYIHPWLILTIGIGALFAVSTMAQSSLAVLRPANLTVVGKVLTPEQHPRLWDVVDEVARSVGTDPPDEIVAGLDPTFYVTEAEITSLDGKLIDRKLYLSLPLCWILTRDEFRAIVAHELGHFHGADTEFSLRFFPVYRGASESLAGVLAASNRGVRLLGTLPAIVVLRYFLDSFAVAEAAISRDRELAADQVAARVVNGRSLAIALVRLQTYSSIWSTVIELTNKAVSANKVYKNLSLVFRSLANQTTHPSLASDARDTALPHPTDSHPRLSVRLNALGITLDSVAGEALMIPSSSLAIDLLEGYERLESELSEVTQALMHHVMKAQLSVQS